MAKYKKKVVDKNDPNMAGHTGDAPEADNSNEGVWSGLEYQRAKCEVDECGYILPVIKTEDEGKANEPGDPDAYSN